jgi:beta-ureidopropionase / N-carbamoyl-L-amino-acid hydrolase
MELAEIGATPKGGVCRLALSDLGGAARRRFVRWCEDAGCAIAFDAIGNIFAHRPGRQAELPPVLAGSHLDTQPTGGKFDGAYGVIAALEVLCTLNDHQIETEAPVEIVAWTNEEGSRFQPVMMGSGVYVGAHDLQTTLTRSDRDGVTVGEALKRIGFAGDPGLFGRPACAYFEPHIEQGPVLEDANVVIGVVTGALGLRWLDVVATGQDAHAGTIPLARRRDAMLATAEVVAELDRIAHAHPPSGRATVGAMTVAPNTRNVIAGQVTFTVDLRHADETALSAIEDAFRGACTAIGAARSVSFSISQVSAYPVTQFDASAIAAVRTGAETLGVSHMDIVSGAGHDAVNMAGHASTAMIFVPCAGGISHNELEAAEPAHLEAGCNVLLQAVLAKAGRR